MEVQKWCWWIEQDANKKKTIDQTNEKSASTKAAPLKGKETKASAIDPIAKALLEQRTKILKARAAQEDGDVEESKGQDQEDSKESAAMLLVPPFSTRIGSYWDTLQFDCNTNWNYSISRSVDRHGW
jgi:hypothetical protein